MTAVMMRDAVATDASGIAAIWNPIIRDTAISFWSHLRSDAEIVAFATDRQTQGHAFMVATLGDAIAGFATYAPFRGGPGYVRALEHSVHVHPDHRGQGVGAALLRAIEDHAHAAGGHLMIGAITGDNHASQIFHRRMGYEQWGFIPEAGWKFERFHDLVLMGRRLAGAAPRPLSDAPVSG